MGSKQEGEDDAGTSHKYDGASCGATHEGVFRIVGRH